MTALGTWIRRLLGSPPISSSHSLIDRADASRFRRGWKAPAIVARQQAAFDPLLADLRSGHARRDFAALADAVRACGLVNPSIVEVGCATGWNGEVLKRLLAQEIDYIGVDYSPAMIAAAARAYPGVKFAIGDASALPFGDAVCDIVVSGTVLMHVADYESAILESRRVAKRWVVFHTVPVVQRRPTTMLTKRAYGQPVVEVIFNEGELLERFRAAQLRVRETIDSVPYDLEALLGEQTTSRTYLCEKLTH